MPMAELAIEPANGGTTVWVRVAVCYTSPTSVSGTFLLSHSLYDDVNGAAASTPKKARYTIITVNRLFLSFYKDLYNSSYFLAGFFKKNLPSCLCQPSCSIHASVIINLFCIIHYGTKHFVSIVIYKAEILFLWFRIHCKVLRYP